MGDKRTGKKSTATAFQRTLRGLREAVAHAKGEATNVVVHAPNGINVKKVRAKSKS